METIKLRELGVFKRFDDGVRYVEPQTLQEYLEKEESFKSAIENCKRADWLLQIIKSLNIDKKEITKTIFVAVSNAKHLMVNKESNDVIQACVDYQDGLITYDVLSKYISIFLKTYIKQYEVWLGLNSVMDAIRNIDTSIVDQLEICKTIKKCADTQRKLSEEVSDVYREHFTEDVLHEYESSVK